MNPAIKATAVICAALTAACTDQAADYTTVAAEAAEAAAADKSSLAQQEVDWSVFDERLGKGAAAADKGSLAQQEVNWSAFDNRMEATAVE